MSAPGADHFVIRQQEIDIGVAALVLGDQPAFALQAVPQRRFGSACSRLMVKSGMRESSTKASSASAVPGLSVSRPMMMPDTTSMPYELMVLHALEDRDHHVVVLVHGLQRVGIRGLDATEDGDEIASFIFSRISGRLAMLSVASQASRVM